MIFLVGWLHHYRRSNRYCEHTASFVSMCASATMAWSDKTLAKEFYNEAWKVKNGKGKNEKSYYEGTLRLMGLLFMTGNFPNLYNQ